MAGNQGFFYLNSEPVPLITVLYGFSTELTGIPEGWDISHSAIIQSGRKWVDAAQNRRRKMSVTKKRWYLGRWNWYPGRWNWPPYLKVLAHARMTRSQRSESGEWQGYVGKIHPEGRRSYQGRACQQMKTVSVTGEQGWAGIHRLQPSDPMPLSGWGVRDFSAEVAFHKRRRQSTKCADRVVSAWPDSVQ